MQSREEELKCHNNGVARIFLNGELFELDPCQYRDTEKHRNVTITIRKCKVCGHTDISWERQEDTESEYY